MKLLDTVKVINDNYQNEGVKNGMLGTIIEANIRWESFFVAFPDQRVFDKDFMSNKENIFLLNEEICIGVKIKDLELVKDNLCTDETIKQSLPSDKQDWWCKVENGYVTNLNGKKKNTIAYKYDS